MNKSDHWQTVYQTKNEQQMSWYLAEPETSYALIEPMLGEFFQPAVIDVGGGVSNLVERLLSSNPGIGRPAILDISDSALQRQKCRLEQSQSIPVNSIDWWVGDITHYSIPRPFDVWHDRAVLHFLTDRLDQQRYFQQLNSYLTPGGYAVIATFAKGGPDKCSGLPIKQYDEHEIASRLSSMILKQHFKQLHITPWGSEQLFHFFVFKNNKK